METEKDDQGNPIKPFTVKEAAEYLRLTVSEVLELLRTGVLRGRQISQRKWLIPYSELVRYSLGKELEERAKAGEAGKAESGEEKELTKLNTSVAKAEAKVAEAKAKKELEEVEGDLAKPEELKAREGSLNQREEALNQRELAVRGQEDAVGEREIAVKGQEEAIQAKIEQVNQYMASKEAPLKAKEKQVKDLLGREEAVVKQEAKLTDLIAHYELYLRCLRLAAGQRGLGGVVDNDIIYYQHQAEELRTDEKTLEAKRNAESNHQEFAEPIPVKENEAGK